MKNIKNVGNRQTVQKPKVLLPGGGFFGGGSTLPGGGFHGGGSTLPGGGFHK